MTKWGNIPATDDSGIGDKSRDSGRIIGVNRGIYKVATESDILKGELTGRFKYNSKHASDLPVVGDWVFMKKLMTIYPL